VGSSDLVERAIREGDREALISSLWNDFDPIVTEAIPDINKAKNLLESAGARKVLLCGSGSAVFGIFDSQAAAKSVAESIINNSMRAFATRFVSRTESW
jgi:4-diphosphocytidyl-2-C-methyl-D-erythritol kinase